MRLITHAESSAPPRPARPLALHPLAPTVRLRADLPLLHNVPALLLPVVQFWMYRLLIMQEFDP